MGYFQVRHDSRVVIYERKMFIRLATGGLNLDRRSLRQVRRPFGHNYGPTFRTFCQKKWANISLFFKQTIQFLQQINVKKCHVHPVSGTGIRTHDLWNLSFLP